MPKAIAPPPTPAPRRWKRVRHPEKTGAVRVDLPAGESQLPAEHSPSRAMHTGTAGPSNLAPADASKEWKTRKRRMGVTHQRRKTAQRGSDEEQALKRDVECNILSKMSAGALTPCQCKGHNLPIEPTCNKRLSGDVQSLLQPMPSRWLASGESRAKPARGRFPGPMRPRPARWPRPPHHQEQWPRPHASAARLR